MNLTNRKNILRAAKVGILLFATLVLSTAYSTPRPVRGTSMSNFPAAHADFLGTASYEAIFDDATGTADPGPPGPKPIIVGPNVRVNAPQSAPQSICSDGAKQPSPSVKMGPTRLRAGMMPSASPAHPSPLSRHSPGFPGFRATRSQQTAA